MASSLAVSKSGLKFKELKRSVDYDPFKSAELMPNMVWYHLKLKVSQLEKGMIDKGKIILLLFWHYQAL